MKLPTLLLFPGLGADARTYKPQRQLPLNLEVAEWIEPLTPDEPLAHYAGRMAAALGPRPDAYVGGISLGAMVALEAANRLQARGVFAIGGCSSHRQIAPLFRATLAAGAALPEAAIRPALSLLAHPALRLFERLNRDQIRLMTLMLREHSPRRVRWSCRAILNWECSDPPKMPVYAIHGERDEVIPLRGVNPVHVVPGGRHLISISHPDEVNRFILERV